MNNKLMVNGAEISVTTIDDKDYISLTDMLKAKDGDFFISDWLRNRNTVEFLGIWEQIHNPDFNYGEFAIIRSQAGLNSYKLSVKEWVEKTNAIGLKARAGRYGGTYAYKDIAFEFGIWISPEFKIYLIKEFERLKEQEQQLLGWDIKRNLAKINYRIHTDAIKENLIPKEITKQQAGFVYANEADLLNVALFGITAKEWRENNPEQKGNTCLAGDIIGDYSFDKPLEVGDKVIFEDMIHYTMVKTTTFNGIKLPSIVIKHDEKNYEIVKNFGYNDYKMRLS